MTHIQTIKTQKINDRLLSKKSEGSRKSQRTNAKRMSIRILCPANLPSKTKEKLGFQDKN
jgi:hypothetical protein